MSAPSAKLRALVEDQAPRKPYCGPEKNRSRIRPLATALEMPYLQLNQPQMRSWLILDVDKKEGGHRWEGAGLPPPTYVAISRDTTKAHIGYALESPVCTSMSARNHPIRYLAAIEAAYRTAMQGDVSFRGGKSTSKNPLHPRWLLWEPANAPVYELSVLAEYVPSLPKRLPKRSEAVSLGRNCKLFDDLSSWSYAAIRKFWGPGRQEAWEEAVRSQAESMNDFTEPLSNGEVRRIARSVARWTWRRITPVGFRNYQAAVGAKKGQRKRDECLEDAIRMSLAGQSNKAIAAALGISPPTVANWLRGGTQ